MLEDTNDIGFQAVEVNDGFGLEPGVWFKLCLGGITGHRDFTRETGVVVRPKDACMVADAVVRVFIDHGNRTDRTKARLKYVLDAIGVEKFLGLMEEKLGRKLDRAVPGAVAPRPEFSRTAHIGIHPQKQDGLNWIGVVVPVGRLTVAQMHGLADVARDCGDGDIRLTVWQNLLISGVPTEKLARRRRASRRSGLGIHGERDPLRPRRLHRQYRLQIRCLRHQAPCRGDRQLVRDARRARHAGQYPSHRLSSFLRAALYFRDRPARLQGSGRTKTPIRSRAITSWSAAGSAPHAAIGRELYRDVVADDAPRIVERILKSYVANRASPQENFLAFTRRHDTEALKTMAEQEAAE